MQFSNMHNQSDAIESVSRRYRHTLGFVNVAGFCCLSLTHQLRYSTLSIIITTIAFSHLANRYTFPEPQLMRYLIQARTRSTPNTSKIPIIAKCERPSKLAAAFDDAVADAVVLPVLEAELECEVVLTITLPDEADPVMKPLGTGNVL